MTNLINQSIGRYHILEQLGQGGMAAVYKAYDTRLEREVAIKVIRTDAFPPAVLDRILKRFEREARSLARLSDPYIVKVYDFGEYEGSPYLVMELHKGGTLKERLGKPINSREAAELLLPVAKALAYAHTHGVLHRDVKPSNILITERGDAILTDFGIAKLLEDTESHTLTGTGVGIGTPEYMAPEQGLGSQIDCRADIYSLGVVFYELLTGKKPFQAETPLAVLLKQVNDPLPRPKQYIPDLPDEVERVIFKALAKKSEDRYETMAAFAAALEGLVHVQPVAAPVPQSPLPITKRKDPGLEQFPMQDHVLPGEPETVDLFASKNVEPQTIKSEKPPGKLWPVFINRNILLPSKWCTLIGHTDSVLAVAFSPDGSTLASGSEDGTIILWEANSGEKLHILTGHSGSVECVAFSPDSSTLASASADNTIILWDAKSGEILHTLTGHKSDVHSVAFSPDGSFLASGSSDTTVIMWDALNSGKLRTFTSNTDEVLSVAFSPDGSILASGSWDKKVILWDVKSGEKLCTLTGHKRSVLSVAFSPDGSTLASGSRDRTTILWDIKSREILHTLAEHTDTIITVAFSSDGSTLASGSLDKTIILWDAKSGEILHTLAGHKSSVYSVAFSPDGRTIASGSSENSVVLWDLEE